MFEKVGCVSLYEMYNMTFPCPPWATQKNSVSFLFFSHVSLHSCSSCTMFCCTLLYGIDLCSRCAHVCNSPENSSLASLLLLHTTYTMYLLYNWCCHDTLHLWYLLFLVAHSAMCTKPCTFVIFGATISHTDCGILFSKSCRSKSNATVFIEFFAY